MRVLFIVLECRGKLRIIVAFGEQNIIRRLQRLFRILPTEITVNVRVQIQHARFEEENNFVVRNVLLDELVSSDGVGSICLIAVPTACLQKNYCARAKEQTHRHNRDDQQFF